MTTPFKFVRRQHVAAFAIALIVCAQQTPGAEAGNCQETARKDYAIQSQIRIKNRTGEELTAKFYIEGVRDYNLKRTVDISDGKNGQYNFSTGVDGDSRGIARIAVGGTEAMECTVHITKQSRKTALKLPRTIWTTGNCKLINTSEAPCPTCTSACQKSWESRPQRWETTFTITK